ncbi:nitroreductase family protein [Spirochaetia bacterium]|nr:nitroreductase family protein [Spirochaetia bacterium]
MNEIIRIIMERRTIRHYKAEQIKDEELKQIIEAGLWAPSAGGRQVTKFLICQNSEINEKIGRINRSFMPSPNKVNDHNVNEKQISIAEDATIQNAFYGAPTVITVFAADQFKYPINDASVAAENMMLTAWSLGIGSAYIGRAEETFKTEEGKNLMENNGIDSTYTARVCVCLGYPDGEIGKGKIRKEDRIYFVKD